tara:strand:- start:327 stop:506 length:180 start_codon:yes stop_codon:yes gene_type:complete
MIAETCFHNIYQEILKLCAYDFLSFTKEDVECMPPFEREGYISIIDQQLKEAEEQRKHR